MTDLTERYLGAALRGIPQAQREDVEGELRSSIADAVEDRVRGGEDQADAEKAVLEELGDPTRLAAGLAGRPLYLIGPDLFVEYRRLLTLLLTIVLPIVGFVQVGLHVVDGEDLMGALLFGVGAAWTVGLHIFFWVTLTFAAVERFDAARDAREEITRQAGRWTVDRLPVVPSSRMSAVEAVGDILMIVLSVGGLLFLNQVAWFTDAAGELIPLFNPDLWNGWMPALIAVLLSIAALTGVVFLIGRWTMPLAVLHAVLQVAFAVPVAALAVTGSLINPAFAEALGWPQLAEGDGVAMIGLAAGVILVTAGRSWRCSGEPVVRR